MRMALHNITKSSRTTSTSTLETKKNMLWWYLMVKEYDDKSSVHDGYIYIFIFRFIKCCISTEFCIFQCCCCLVKSFQMNFLLSQFIRLFCYMYYMYLLYVCIYIICYLCFLSICKKIIRLHLKFLFRSINYCFAFKQIVKGLIDFFI